MLKINIDDFAYPSTYPRFEQYDNQTLSWLKGDSNWFFKRRTHRGGDYGQKTA
jgi:hypothetical protein